MSLLGSVLSGVFGFMGNQANINFQQQSNLQNLMHADRWNNINLRFQHQTNLENREFINQLNQQQIQMQHEAWNREDTAVQRRAADLQSAGMNPLLAAGQGAQASGPINLNAHRSEAPQGRHLARMEAARIETDIAERVLRMRDDFATNAASRKVMEATALEHIERAESIREERGLLWIQQGNYHARMNQLAATIEHMGVQNALIREQEETERLRQSQVSASTAATILDNTRRVVENEVARQTADDRISQVEQDLIATSISNQIMEREEEIRSNLGITTQGSWNEKLGQFIIHQFNRFMEFRRADQTNHQEVPNTNLFRGFDERWRDRN